MDNYQFGEHLRDQGIGGAVHHVNSIRESQLSEALAQILKDKNYQLEQQDGAFLKALCEIGKVREILSRPEHILGSDKSKHGEVAEAIEVFISRAKGYLNQEQPNSILLNQGSERFGPIDYILDGIKVQSKFVWGNEKNTLYQSANEGLRSIIKQLEKYPDFSQDGIFQIPKDQYQLIENIKNGNSQFHGSGRTAEVIRQKIEEIESSTGKTFQETVRPSISTYKDVGMDEASKTLDKHTEDIYNQNKKIEEEIKSNSQRQNTEAQQAHAPSWGQAVQMGAIGAAVGGSFSAAFSVYGKMREGKPITEFSSEDWTEIGMDFGKGGYRGGVSGMAIYGMTNLTHIPAPLAGAFVSTCFGVASLTNSYLDGEIGADELVEQGSVLCFDAGTVALSASIGQVAIPIPVVGALTGTIAAKILGDLLKKNLGEKSAEMERMLEKRYQETLSKLDLAYRKTVIEITEIYEKKGRLTAMAFDFNSNASLRLEKSVDLARDYGVPENKILKTVACVDNFMLA
jgi:hypothetical protein